MLRAQDAGKPRRLSEHSASGEAGPAVVDARVTFGHPKPHIGAPPALSAAVHAAGRGRPEETIQWPTRCSSMRPIRRKPGWSWCAGKVEEFDFESATRRQLRGNIYLAKVTRVEPSLQAAFVDYGGNRHGFLAFSEIHPDYYQIPVADRQALIADEERAHREAEAELDRRANRHRDRRRPAAAASAAVKSETVEDDHFDDGDDEANGASAAATEAPGTTRLRPSCCGRAALPAGSSEPTSAAGAPARRRSRRGCSARDAGEPWNALLPSRAAHAVEAPAPLRQRPQRREESGTQSRTSPTKRSASRSARGRAREVQDAWRFRRQTDQEGQAAADHAGRWSVDRGTSGGAAIYLSCRLYRC